QEDGGGGGGRDVADGVPVPGVEGLGVVAAAHGVREGDAENWRRGHSHPTQVGERRQRRARRDVVSDDADRVGRGEVQGYCRDGGIGRAGVDRERGRGRGGVGGRDVDGQGHGAGERAVVRVIGFGGPTVRAVVGAADRPEVAVGRSRGRTLEHAAVEEVDPAHADVVGGGGLDLHGLGDGVRAAGRRTADGDRGRCEIGLGGRDRDIARRRVARRVVRDYTVVVGGRGGEAGIGVAYLVRPQGGDRAPGAR